MSDCAVITTSRSVDPKNDSDSLGIYLRWCGRKNSVKSFLTYCKIHDFHSPSDNRYGWAILACVISNFFGDGRSCGVDVCSRLGCDNYGNGVYVIDGWDIVDHKYFSPCEDGYDILEFLYEIDERMPKHIQLGKDVITKKYNDLNATF